jgi:hypothetical protein
MNRAIQRDGRGLEPSLIANDAVVFGLPFLRLAVFQNRSEAAFPPNDLREIHQQRRMVGTEDVH